MKLAYCDYIASEISKSLDKADAPTYSNDKMSASKPKWDLHPTGGYLQSTKKIVEVTDHNGKKYRVTVEEINDEY